MPGAALAEIVNGGDDDDNPLGSKLGPADLHAVRAPHVAHLGKLALAEHRDEGLMVEGRAERRGDVAGFAERDVERREDAAPNRQQVRREDDGRATTPRIELLLDLSHVPVPSDGVGAHIFLHLAEQEIRLGRAARTARTRFRVDHDRAFPDQARPYQWHQPEKCARRVAPGHRHDTSPAHPLSGELGNPVHRLGEQLGCRVIAVPALELLLITQTKVRAEIDNHYVPLESLHDRRGGRPVR